MGRRGTERQLASAVGSVRETAPVVETGIIPTGYERRLPPEAQLVVRARRRQLVERAGGRVLDLGGADSHPALWSGREALVLAGASDPRLAELAAGGERFDTVVSVLQLAAAGDIDELLGHVHALVGDEGRLLFLEPVRLIGAAGRLQRLAAPGVRTATSLHVDRDIPDLLRRAALSVTSLERHRVPTLLPWLRQLVEGCAHRALAPGAGAART